jgi:CheY-like chemotaxis protein
VGRALIAEDEPLIRELTAEYLERAGFEVCEVADGELGLALLNRDRDWDVLFADVRMPGEIDGWQLAQVAKLLVPDLRVIYASSEVNRVAGLSRHETFLEKPYHYEDVEKALHAVE